MLKNYFSDACLDVKVEEFLNACHFSILKIDRKTNKNQITMNEHVSNISDQGIIFKKGKNTRGLYSFSFGGQQYIKLLSALKVAIRIDEHFSVDYYEFYRLSTDLIKGNLKSLKKTMVFISFKMS